MSGAPRQLDALTGLRGIAAWAVVLYHVRLSLAALLPAPAIAALGKGYLAVDLFFILSGFVIWYNYAERLAAGGAGAVRAFLWRRLARVWPLHGAVLLSFVALAALLALTGRATTGYPLAELPLHLALVQNWGLTGDLAWNHPAWSISTEWAAYLLFPLGVALFGVRPLPAPALLAVGATCAGLVHLVYALAGHTTLGPEIARLGLWRCLGGFGLGMVLCQLWQRGRERSGMAGWAAGAALGWAWLGWQANLPETALALPLFALLLGALAWDRGPIARGLAARPLRYLGEISYSTYLAHFGLFIVWKLLFVGPSLQLGWAGLAGYLALVAAASALLYHGLELPAQRWLNAHPPRWARVIRAPQARSAQRQHRVP